MYSRSLLSLRFYIALWKRKKPNQSIAAYFFKEKILSLSEWNLRSEISFLVKKTWKHSNSPLFGRKLQEEVLFLPSCRRNDATGHQAATEKSASRRTNQSAATALAGWPIRCQRQRPCGWGCQRLRYLLTSDLQNGGRCRCTSDVGFVTDLSKCLNFRGNTNFNGLYSVHPKKI